MSKADIQLIARINKTAYDEYLTIMVELIVTMEDFDVITVY